MRNLVKKLCAVGISGLLLFSAPAAIWADYPEAGYSPETSDSDAATPDETENQAPASDRTESEYMEPGVTDPEVSEPGETNRDSETGDTGETEEFIPDQKQDNNKEDTNIEESLINDGEILGEDDPEAGEFSTGSALMNGTMGTAAPQAEAGASGYARIHMITLPNNAEAILLETEVNGVKKYAMVDCGEDDDYPDGTQGYPYRTGVVKGNGNEVQVSSLLSGIGVTKQNLEFVICTHAHSDHIGYADTVIRNYAPKRVYMLEYSDTYIADSSRFWDNLYVYNHVLEACRATPGVKLIQHLNPSAASVDEGKPTFSFGAFEINIVNYQEDYKQKKNYDANQFSLGVVARANGLTAFLSADIDNTDGTGDLDRIISEFGLYGITLLTTNHHGHSNANEISYLKTVRPAYVFQDGSFKTMSRETTDAFEEMNSRLFSSAAYYGTKSSLTINFSGGRAGLNVTNTFMKTVNSAAQPVVYYDGLPENGIFVMDGAEYYADHGVLRISKTWTDADGKTYKTDQNGKLIAKPQGYVWVNQNGKWYYKDGNQIQKGWLKLGEKTYYLDPTTGERKSGWVQVDESWYYFSEDGVMTTGWLQLEENRYYLNPEDGSMAVGWTEIDGELYYLNPEDGAMRRGGWFIDPEEEYVYYLQPDGKAYKNTEEEIENCRYLFDEQGRISNPTLITLEDRTYFVSEGKIWKEGWTEIDEKPVFFDPETGEQQKDGWIIDPAEDYAYYLQSDGTPLRKTKEKIDGHVCIFDEFGRVANRTLIVIRDKTYLLEEGRVLRKSGWSLVQGGKYYFCPEDSSLMINGWFEDPEDGYIYYMKADGVAITGTSKKIGDYFYTFDEEGRVLSDGWLMREDAVSYVMGGKLCKDGAKIIEGREYLFDEHGLLISKDL